MRKIPLLAGLFATASEIPENNGLDGWGGRDRTSEWGNQNPLPYRLATPQRPNARNMVSQAVEPRRSTDSIPSFQPAGDA